MKGKFPTEVPMFSATHIGILLGAAILITVLLIDCVKKKVSLDTILTGMVVVTIFSEMGKVFSRTVVSVASFQSGEKRAKRYG